MARTNGLVAFLGGMGAGYLQGEKEKKERERQAKLDQIVFDEAERKKIDYANEDAVNKGLKDAGAMKVGDVRDQNGVVDTSQQGFAARLAAQGVDAETIAKAAPVYANAAARDGAGSWLDNSFQNADGSGGIGKTKVTEQEDIDNARAAAFASGGAKYDANRMAALKDAATAKFSDGVRKIMAWDPASGDFSTIKKVYGTYDDGHDIHSEMGQDGKFHVFYTDAEGNKVNRQTYDSPAEFKQQALAHLVDPNNAMASITNIMRYEDRKFDKTMAIKKDARDEVSTASAIASQGVTTKINEGKLANLGREQDDAHAASQANIRQSDAATESSRANTDKTKTETGVLKAGGGKPLTDADRTKSSDIKGARLKIGSLSKEDLAFINSGDIGMNAAISPRQKQLQELHKTAMETDPAAVKIYGTDPHRDRFMAGGKPYKYTPLIPSAASREVGTIYELPDGTAGKWDGKGLIPVK